MKPLNLTAFDPDARITPESVALVEQRITADSLKYSGWRRGGKGLGCLIPGAVLLGGSLLFYLVMGLAGQVDWSALQEAPISAAVTLGVAFGILTLAFVGLLTAIVQAATDRRSPETLVRVLAFARDNGLEFEPQSPADGFHGRVWDYGKTFRIDHLTGSDGVDYGTVGRAGKNGTVGASEVGYLAIPLERKLPHIVLMRRRGSRFNVGDGPELQLEGDFSKHFELHVPRGYETDALYVLTPDVMQVLIDEAADRHVEIVDDWLFVFGDRPDLTLAATHERFHRIASAVGGEVIPQTDAYRDDRITRDPLKPLAINRVTPAGRRLAPIIWIPGLLLAIAVATSPFWGLIAQAIADAAGG